MTKKGVKSITYMFHLVDATYSLQNCGYECFGTQYI